MILMAANMVAMSQDVTNAVLTGLRPTRPLMIREMVGVGGARNWASLAAAGAGGLLLYAFLAERLVVDAGERARLRTLIGHGKMGQVR